MMAEEQKSKSLENEAVFDGAFKKVDHIDINAFNYRRVKKKVC